MVKDRVRVRVRAIVTVLEKDSFCSGVISMTARSWRPKG
jgi:hypothetical protein